MRVLATATDVVDAFKLRGFEFVGRGGEGRLRLHGQLNSGRGDRFPCEIELDPMSFELPRIRLLKIPPHLPPLVPHISGEGVLCYIAQGTVVLDIFDAVGQSLACLKRAEEVFAKIVSGEMVEDLEEEFYACWYGQFCFVDMQGVALGQQHCRVLDANGQPLFCVTDDLARSSKKLHVFKAHAKDGGAIRTFRVKTKAPPRPLSTQWPPRTVSELLDWQSTLDVRCRRKIHGHIRDALASKADGVLILIESPLLTYGVSIFFDGVTTNRKKKKKRSKSRRDPTLTMKVTPVAVIRIDDRYLAQRNIPDRTTLLGKNIAIVGCGTIGGYLADMLVKAGAGAASGKLTLVDPDTLMPPNLGRHRLGFPELFFNKAAGMATELLRLAPTANIQPLPVDVKQAKLDDSLDLLIDATGEESLGHWLCQHYLNRTAMLTVWIEGPGTLARGLLRTGTHGACYRCLWHSTRRGELRAVADEIPAIMAGQGCEGLYVPFPATVSVQAASLGAEMVLDWVNGVSSPALRTRVIDPRFQRAAPDSDPAPDRDCPVCQS